MVHGSSTRRETLTPHIHQTHPITQHIRTARSAPPCFAQEATAQDLQILRETALHTCIARCLCTHNSFLSSRVVAQGPSVTTIADPLVEWVERYTQQLGFEFSDEREMPYLFYCSGSTSRNVSSSQWTTMVHLGSSLPALQPCSLVALLLQVKDAFAKFSPGNIGVPPKLLR